MAQLLLLPPSVMIFPSASECSPDNLPNLISRGLVNAWEPFSKGVAPARAHSKVRERRRGPVGFVLPRWASHGHVCHCLSLWGCSAVSRRKAKNLVRVTLWLCGAGGRVSPGCLKCKFIRPHGAVSKSWWRSGYFWAQLRGLGNRGYFKTAPLCSPCHESLLPISPRALLGSGSSLKVLPDLKHVDVVAFQERLFQWCWKRASSLSLGQITNFRVGRTIWT